MLEVGRCVWRWVWRREGGAFRSSPSPPLSLSHSLTLSLRFLETTLLPPSPSLHLKIAFYLDKHPPLTLSLSLSLSLVGCCMLVPHALLAACLRWLKAASHPTTTLPAVENSIPIFWLCSKNRHFLFLFSLERVQLLRKESKFQQEITETPTQRPPPCRGHKTVLTFSGKQTSQSNGSQRRHGRKNPRLSTKVTFHTHRIAVSNTDKSVLLVQQTTEGRETIVSMITMIKAGPLSGANKKSHPLLRRICRPANGQSIRISLVLHLPKAGRKGTALVGKARTTNRISRARKPAFLLQPQHQSAKQSGEVRIPRRKNLTICYKQCASSKPLGEKLNFLLSRKSWQKWGETMTRHSNSFARESRPVQLLAPVRFDLQNSLLHNS